MSTAIVHTTILDNISIKDRQVQYAISKFASTVYIQYCMNHCMHRALYTTLQQRKRKGDIESEKL